MTTTTTIFPLPRVITITLTSPAASRTPPLNNYHYHSAHPRKYHSPSQPPNPTSTHPPSTPKHTPALTSHTPRHTHSSKPTSVSHWTFAHSTPPCKLSYMKITPNSLMRLMPLKVSGPMLQLPERVVWIDYMSEWNG